MGKRKELSFYEVELNQMQHIFVQIVATSKSEAKRKMRKILDNGQYFNTEDPEWMEFNKHATIGEIECCDGATPEDDDYPDWDKDINESSSESELMDWEKEIRK